MKQVITVNLNGKAVQIEEDAQSVLHAYVERASKHLATNPDKAEILADLEQAIADKGSRYMSAHKDVLTLAEIETILAEMGPVETESGAADAERKEVAPNAATPKKFYLIREGALIGGVCTGLAAFFNLDVTLVRVLFVVLTLVTSGAGILVYIALMIFVPYAETPEELAAASGMPFNAQDVVNRAKANFERAKK